MKPFLRALYVLLVTCLVLVAARRDRDFLQRKNGGRFWQGGQNDAFDDDDFTQMLNDMKIDVTRQENDGPFGYGTQVRKRARLGQVDMFDEEYLASDPKRGQAFFRQTEQLCPRGKFDGKNCRRGQSHKSGKSRHSVKFGQGKHHGQGRYFDQAKHFGQARQFGKSRRFGQGKQFSRGKFFDADAPFDRRQKHGHTVKGRKGV